MPDQNAYILKLAGDLIDDMELSRLSPEQLLSKCSRLARLAGSDLIQKWLEYERLGYNNTDPISILYISLTGRWIDYEARQAYWGPLSAQVSTIESARLTLQALRVPDISLSEGEKSPYSLGVGFSANTALMGAQNAINTAATSLQTHLNIQSRVLALLHDFVVHIYHEKQFSSVADGLFSEYQLRVDKLLAEKCGDVTKKIPSINERLFSGDTEAISQALTSCRRMIDEFADAIYPPTTAVVDMDGNTVELTADKHQNRINAYVRQRTESKSRREKIRKALTSLYGRVSAGVHSDVTSTEAKGLFLETYILLGEIISLPQPTGRPADTE